MRNRIKERLRVKEYIRANDACAKVSCWLVVGVSCETVELSSQIIVVLSCCRERVVEGKVQEWYSVIN